MAQLITTAQNTKLHTLLSQFGLMEHKKAILLEYTGGRTDSSRQLTMDEARDLISQLSANDPRERHIRAVKHLAYVAGIIYGNTKEDYQMNDAKLDAFLRDRGTVKKELRKMTLEELKKVHKQFEGIVRNNQKTSNNKYAKKATAELLAELNITVKAQ